MTDTKTLENYIINNISKSDTNTVLRMHGEDPSKFEEKYFGKGITIEHDDVSDPDLKVAKEAIDKDYKYVSNFSYEMLVSKTLFSAAMFISYSGMGLVEKKKE